MGSIPSLGDVFGFLLLFLLCAVAIAALIALIAGVPLFVFFTGMADIFHFNSPDFWKFVAGFAALIFVGGFVALALQG